MQQINICGKRGLGDIVSGTSHVLITLQGRSGQYQLNFHYPKGHGYKEAIDTLMSEFQCSHITSHTFSDEWATVSMSRAEEKFGKEKYKLDWFFTYCKSHKYMPFKTKWLGDRKGPIGLMLNNENTLPTYPYPQKWFNDELNSKLSALVDDRTYFALGRPRTVKENIEIMSKCRYVLGVDGAWVHIANAMRVPCFLVRNDLENRFLVGVHKHHPSLRILEHADLKLYVRI